MNRRTLNTQTNSYAGHSIATLLDRKSDGFYGIAYCPICDRAEESHDQGNGQQYALAHSIAKVRTHMRVKHRIKEAAPASVRQSLVA